VSSEYLTISELNNYIRDVINSGFPQPVWVCGEIQNFNRNKGKHYYFELVEKDPGSKSVKAKINIVIFEGKMNVIKSILKQSENAFELKDDIEVKFACKVNFYQPNGSLNLIVENIDPVYTLGKLAQEKQKLIAELKEKGTLDQNKKLELIKVPLNIGLITSDDSAAYNDFISELKRSGYSFKVSLHPALRQGIGTEKDVVKAIQRNISKLGFDCGVRAMYWTKDHFRVSNIKGLLGIMRQYNTNTLNGFVPNVVTGFDNPWEDIGKIRSTARKRRMFKAYKNRGYFYRPFRRRPIVLNTEELATLFHFPGQVAETPTFGRIESRKAEPPSNLPI